MTHSLEYVTGRWLSKMGIKVSQALLREKIQAHPAYPSLLSVTDTLDELGIDNAALQVDKEKIFEMPLPFLAHDNTRKEFVIINNAKKQIKLGSDFEKNWNGIALLAEKPENWNHAENEKRLLKEEKSVQTLTATTLFIVLLAFLSLIDDFSWQTAGLLAATLAGFVIAILIVQQELGISNELTEKLCHSGSNTDCGVVMHSKGSRISKWMNWADACIVYFTSYSLLLITFLFTNSLHGITVLAMISSFAVPVTLFSLYYQWKVVKKWCPLCLFTVAVLWLQFAITAPAAVRFMKGEYGGIISVKELLLVVMIFSIISAAWLLMLKPSLESNKELLGKNFSLLRFKNNPDVFESLLKKQRRIDIAPFENELQLGNPHAPLQIMVACNPYCGPCATAHKVLHDLAQTNDIGLAIRLSVKTGNPEDKRTMAGRYIMELANSTCTMDKRKMMHDWYEWMDLEKFKEKYPLQAGINVQEQLVQHEEWMKEAKIEFTPSVFINGYQLPKQYKPEDLKNLLERAEGNRVISEETTIENNLTLA